MPHDFTMATRLRIQKSKALKGRALVPGDKSISHRALIFGALAKGPSRVTHFLNGSDCLATAQVMRDLGIEVSEQGDGVVIKGRGLPDAFSEPSDVLNCQNSGTTIRLMMGLLAAQPFLSVLSGSDQIRRRPMGRVITPLQKMGARLHGRGGDRLAPVVVRPCAGLSGYVHHLDVASAQVKSALILAGLFADGPSTIIEPGPSRDHSERLLRAMGARIENTLEGVRVWPQSEALSPFEMKVPADPSSAAFLAAAAMLVPGSELVLEDVSINTTRTGFFDALRQMGASLEFVNATQRMNEPIADITLQTTALKACDFGGEIIVRMIDELPILAVLATQAHGITTVRDAKELRVKETDRIATTVSELCKMGARIEARDDGFVVEGPTPLHGALVSSHGDHRLAMALAIAGLCASSETVIEDAKVTVDSFPGFVKTLARLGAEVVEEEG